MPRGPDLDDGPQRFIRKWLTFDAARPTRLRRAWMLVAAILMLLAASALLAVLVNRSHGTG